MKEGALAGKRSVPEPCLPSAKEGGIEGREGILGGGPGLLAQQKMNISLITTLTLNRFFF